MIGSFGNKETENFFNTGKFAKRASLQAVKGITQRKLDMIFYAKDLKDLKSPPANKLEKLKGELEGFYSIRINDQFRIIFKREDSQAFNVEIIDYHR